MSDTTGLSAVLFLDPDSDLDCRSLADGYDYAKRLSREGRTPFDFHWRVGYSPSEEDPDIFVPSELKGLVVFGRDAWVGWAVAESQKMVGADAIIGIPASSSDTAAGSVEAYKLIGQNATSTSQSVALNLDSPAYGEIQQAHKGNQTSTIMQFNRPFIDTTGTGINITANGSQVILFAAGLDNSFTYHSQRGIFALDLVNYACDSKTVSPSTLAPDAPAEQVPLRSNDVEYDWYVWIFEGGGTLSWRVDEDVGVMYMKMLVNVDTGWLGLAVSNEAGEMVGSDAIVGLPGQGVEQYNLWGYSKEEVLVRDVQYQTLLTEESSIEVFSGYTVMKFARYLAASQGEVNSRQIVIGDNTFIFAKGKLNTLSEHLATAIQQLSINIMGLPGFYANGTTTSPPETSSSSESDERDANMACTGSNEEGYEYAHAFAPNVNFHWRLQYGNTSTDDLMNGGYIDGKLVVEGRMGWLGWALSADGTMVGSGAIIGFLEEQDVSQYILWGKRASNVVKRTTQRLKGTAIYYEDGYTSMEFSRPMLGASSEELSLAVDSQYVIYAYSAADYLGAHGKSDSGTIWMNMADCQYEQLEGNSFNLAYAHGWMMSMAYGAVLPLGILVARYGNKTRRKVWLGLHVALQLTGFAMAIVGLCFAREFVKSVYEQQPFQSTHGKRGLAIIVITFVQICLGVMRPAAPSGRWENKSKRRWLWEYCHKLLACVTLTMAVYQVYDGLDKLDNNISTDSWYAAFTGLLAVVIGCFLVLETAKKRKRKPKHTWWEPRTDERYPQMSAN